MQETAYNLSKRMCWPAPVADFIRRQSPLNLGDGAAEHVLAALGDDNGASLRAI